MKDKLTQEDIDAVVISETAAKVGTKTTVVVLTLANGFEVVGTSACVDPANYGHSKGIEVARKRAVDQIWMLEGYLLQQRRTDFKAALHAFEMAGAQGSEALVSE